MKLGILESITFVGTVALAASMVYAGGGLYLSGNPVGLVFIALAVLLVVGQHVLTTPQDVPTMLVEKTVGTALPGVDDSESDSTDGE
jgi:hypothetical protein